MTVYPTTRRLSRTEKLSLASEIFATYGRVRWWMWRRTFPDAVRALHQEFELGVEDVKPEHPFGRGTE